MKCNTISEFNGVINDITFDDKNIYLATKLLIKEIEDRFKIKTEKAKYKEFVEQLVGKVATITTYMYAMDVITYNDIPNIFLVDIIKAKRFEDIKFDEFRKFICSVGDYCINVSYGYVHNLKCACKDKYYE